MEWDENGRPIAPVTEWDENGRPVTKGAARLRSAKVSRPLSFGFGAADAMALSFDDEASGVGAAAQALASLQDPIAAYRKQVDFVRGNKRRAQQDNPWSYGAGQFTGALALPTGKVTSVGEGALKLGAYGLAHGAGSGETLQERAMLAGEEGATSAVMGGIAGKLAPKFGPLPQSSSSKVAAFDRAGVRPTLAAVSPDHSLAPSMTKAIAENWLAGGRPRAAIQASLNDTQEAAQRIAGRYGRVSQPDLVGENVRAGVKQWAGSGGTFRTQAGAMFDKAINPIKDKVAGAPRTRQTVADILTSVTGKESAKFIIPGQIKQLDKVLAADAGEMTFSDLRAMRTKIRSMQDDPSLAQSIGNANLQRIEQALTEDIYANARRLGGPAAYNNLKRADAYYKAGMKRIQSALAPFADRQGTGRTAYERILALASDTGRENIRALNSLKRSLPPSQWSDVSATLIDRLGKVKPSNPAALEPDAFSIDSFVTNYARLSPAGRKVLFGHDKLADELDNLVRVAGMQKSVEKMANFSRAGVSAQNAGTLLSLFSGIGTIPTALGLGGMSLTGEALTNPTFVRWLTRASQPGQGLTRAGLRQLASIAARDPALEPFYRDLNASLEQQSRGPETRQLQAGSTSP